jgi:hypothetical protein
MRTVAKKCLLLKSEQERTNTVLLDRLKGIRKTLRQLSGILRSLESGKVERNPRYWQNTLSGWGDHLQTVVTELDLLYADLLGKMS